MTRSGTVSRNNYVGAGSTDTYSYSFPIRLQTDLLVTTQIIATGVEETLVLTTDYTVTGVGVTAGGTIVLVAGNLPATKKITVRRVVPVTQLADIRNQGTFFPETQENQFDKHNDVDQQQQDELDRSLRLAETEDASALSTEISGLPVAGSVPSVNAAADGLEWVDVDAAALATAVAAAEAAQTGAELAETNAETAKTNAETAKTNAETAETNAQTAQTAAETAQTGAETAETNAVAASFVSGTVMLFQQTAAPTGWTKGATHNDKALRIVTGSVSTGGSVAMSTALATPAISASVGGTIDGHALSEAELPAHTHEVPTSSTSGTGGSAIHSNDNTSEDTTKTTSSVGSGSTHTHGVTGMTATGTATINCQYVDVIIATKD